MNNELIYETLDYNNKFLEYDTQFLVSKIGGIQFISLVDNTIEVKVGSIVNEG